MPLAVIIAGGSSRTVVRCGAAPPGKRPRGVRTRGVAKRRTRPKLRWKRWGRVCAKRAGPAFGPPTMWELALVIGLVAFGWLAYATLRARELAIAFARAACDRQGLQFLDFTVQGARTRFTRNAQGHATLRRIYPFEFTEDGTHRRSGSIVMLGTDVESLHLEPYRVA